MAKWNCGGAAVAKKNLAMDSPCGLAVGLCPGLAGDDDGRSHFGGRRPSGLPMPSGLPELGVTSRLRHDDLCD